MESNKVFFTEKIVNVIVVLYFFYLCLLVDEN